MLGGAICMNFENLRANEKIMFAFRLSLLVIMPFILGAFVLPHTIQVDGQPLGAPTENRYVGFETVSYSSTHSQQDISTPSSINTLFPLAAYMDFPPFITHEKLQLCFQDNGSSLVLPNGSRLFPTFQWNINLNDQQTIILQPNSVSCVGMTEKQRVNYSWAATIDTGLQKQNLNGTITFYPQTYAFTRSVKNYGLLQGLAMIPVLYLIFWYPLAGIWKKMRDGLSTQ